jgi:hypothetical protein
VGYYVKGIIPKVFRDHRALSKRPSRQVALQHSLKKYPQTAILVRFQRPIGGENLKK